MCMIVKWGAALFLLLLLDGLLSRTDGAAWFCPIWFRSFWIFCQLTNISICNVFSGISDDSGTKKDTKTDAQAPSKSSTGSTVAIVCLVVVAIALLLFFLFKVWQKKKREEQYARLLKLFEEDDELELELGLRDWTCITQLRYLMLFWLH